VAATKARDRAVVGRRVRCQPTNGDVSRTRRSISRELVTPIE
jgi:hypothetical protein